MKFSSNKFFKPTRAILTPTTSCFPCCARWILSILITKVSQGNYEHFHDVGLDKLIKSVKRSMTITSSSYLTSRTRRFARLGMDFASILSAEYGEAMPEERDAGKR